MHRSIAGLADAFQSIADAKATLNGKEKRNGSRTISREMANANIDIESDQRMNDASQHFLDMENCTSRIAAKLREIDNIDLNLHAVDDEEVEDPDARVSNQKRFIDDQCHRAQSLLSGEYYLRNLHSQEVHKDILELDERINYTAKNWKHALIELGINESDLAELKAPAVEAAKEAIVEKSDSRKVRRNTVITQPKSSTSMVAVEADYSDYNSAEFSELNEILTQFMDHAFLNGANGYQLSNEIMDRCKKFKEKMLGFTNQLIETEKRKTKTAVRDAQRAVRLLETDLALLHSQHEEADLVIRNQKDADKVIRRVVEEKFAESLNQLGDHKNRLDTKIEAQLETNKAIQKRFVEVQAMFQELQKQRLFADPFVRRRAENLVKGLLRNLNEQDIKEQEEREQEMSAHYQQWKKIVEFCNEKERQLGLMESQEASLREEITNQTARIEKERVLYRERVKVLKSKDDEQSGRLKVLEEKLSDKARDERRKLHFEQRGEARKQPMHLSHAITTNIPEKRSAGGSGGDGGAVECNSDSEGGDDYQSQSDHREGAAGNTGNDADTSDSESSSESSSSENSQHSDSGDGGATTGKFSKTDARSKRIKQHGVRTVAPLCDDYTEVLLGVTHEHTKRQEISRTVFTHIPRPAAGHVTGSEQSDTALLVKAQKMLSDLHPQQAAPPEGAEARQGISKFAEETSVGTVGEGETALAAKDKPEPAEPAEPAEPEPEWATQTNSTPKTTAVVKFGQDSSRRQSSLSRKSNGSSSKVKYGFWAEVDPGEVDGGESSSEEEDGFFPGGSKDERRQKGVQVHSLTSTACYVALYYRYLKKFPNLNFKKDNPRLQSPTQQIVRNPLLPTAAPSDAKSGASDQVGSRASVIGSANDATATPVAASSELVNKNNRFQFSVKEGLVVVKEALDALLQCKVVDKIIISEALSKMSELERRGKLAGIPEEEKEVRYQLHFLCVSLIHTVLSRGPRVLLVKNNRKYFVEISSCMLALLGVVLNCSLVFWQPRSVSKSSKSTKSSKIHSRSGAISSGAGVGAGGGIAMDRVEFICAHLIELVITLGDVDTSHPLSDSSGGTVAAITENRSTRRSSKKSGKNFKVKKPTDTPPGPAGFISLLRIQTAELLHKKQEEKLSTAGAGSAGSAGDRGSSLSREDRRGTPKSSRPGSTPHSSNSEGLGVNYHDLLEVFNKIVDEDAPIESVVGQDGTFTMKHRHAILSLQLFLYLSLNNNEMPMENAILLLHKGIMDGVASVRADESNVIPCDVDILLQQMHPGMVPAVLTLELIRRVLEAEFERVAFLKKIADAHHDVADLQFLNVEFASQFDVSMKTNRQMMSNKPKGSHLCEGSGSSVGTVSLPSLSITAPAPTLGAPSDGPAEVPSSPRSVHPMHITRFKTTKSVHVQWVEDLELNLRQLSEEIIALIRPPSVATGVREPSFMSDKPPAAVATEGLLSPSSQKSTKNPVIPLPDILVYQMLAHINTLRSITMTHSINGLARVESLQPAFVQIMRDLLAARSRITAIVTAMTWPMRKKLDWLKLKYNTLLEENAAATNQVGEFKALLDRYKRDIETFKSSIAQVDKEKHSMDYRHTRTLLLEHHDSQIQDLIVEHATDEYLHKLTDFRARETRLNSTILQFTTEHAQLMAQADTLKAAQRSLSMIDQAQDSAETSMRSDHAGQSGFGDKFGLEGMDALGGFDQYRDGVNNLNEFQAPKVPPAVSELLNAVDEFVHTQRLADVVPAKALKDPPQKNKLSARKVLEMARAQELARHKLKNIASKVMSRPKLPLFGKAASLQPRDDPTVPAKLFGFAKRIDSGLQAVSAFKENTGAKPSATSATAGISDTVHMPHLPHTHAHWEDGVIGGGIGGGGLFEGSASTVFTLESGGGTQPPGQLGEMSDTLSEGPGSVHSPVRGVYTAGLGREGDGKDLFGQKASPSLRDRISKTFLRKNSRRRKNTKMGRLIEQFVLSSYGGKDYYRDGLLQHIAPDSPLMTPDQPDSEMTEEQRAEWRRIARMNVRGDPISVVFTKKPDLEQANRKSLAFMSPLQRSNPYHYDEIVNEDLRNNFTPLNIRKLIDQLREAQREEIAARQAADPSWQPPQDLHPDGTVDAAATATTGREPAASIEFDDELEDDDEGEREGDEKGERIAVGGFFSNKWGGGSSRDQNVGTGVTYPEYLLWRSKRKQQQQDGQQLDALKNSLNIQLRNARRVASVTESTQHEDLEHHGGEEDAALTEEQFAALGTASDLAKATGGDVQRAMHRDYSAANTEVDFILSRSNSHLDALGAIQRKFSSKKRTSVGSSLHFNTAALMSGNNAPGAETEEGSAATEAGRRARGESMMSARASLSLRARASLLGKLNRALESIESKMSEDSPGRRASSRLSVLNKLSTISERPSARSSIVRHSSMLKPTAIPELQLKEARDIANSIIHGKPVKDGGDKKERHSTADPGFDMQILEYIANDQLIMSGWESVDLFKMNDNETFSGHSFKFDDQDDRARAATLKEFTKQVASRSETSASAVESEFRAAIVNLNRLVGKKISDTAVLDAPPAPQHEQQAEPEAEGAPLGASGSARSVRTEKTSEASLLPRAQLHKDQSTVGFSRSNSECGAEEVTTSTTPAAVPAEGVDPPPHRPQEPKPSATFASPRRKVFLADPSSLIF